MNKNYVYPKLETFRDQMFFRIRALGLVGLCY